jgi:hypothetical protein
MVLAVVLTVMVLCACGRWLCRGSTHSVRDVLSLRLFLLPACGLLLLLASGLLLLDASCLCLLLLESGLRLLLLCCFCFFPADRLFLLPLL